MGTVQLRDRKRCMAGVLILAGYSTGNRGVDTLNDRWWQRLEEDGSRLHALQQLTKRTQHGFLGDLWMPGCLALGPYIGG